VHVAAVMEAVNEVHDSVAAYKPYIKQSSNHHLKPKSDNLNHPIFLYSRTIAFSNRMDNEVSNIQNESSVKSNQFDQSALLARMEELDKLKIEIMIQLEQTSK
jgi:hypothetical protein